MGDYIPTGAYCAGNRIMRGSTVWVNYLLLGADSSQEVPRTSESMRELASPLFSRLSQLPISDGLLLGTAITKRFAYLNGRRVSFPGGKPIPARSERFSDETARVYWLSLALRLPKSWRTSLRITPNLRRFNNLPAVNELEAVIYAAIPSALKAVRIDGEDLHWVSERAQGRGLSRPPHLPWRFIRPSSGNPGAAQWSTVSGQRCVGFPNVLIEKTDNQILSIADLLPSQEFVSYQSQSVITHPAGQAGHVLDFFAATFGDLSMDCDMAVRFRFDPPARDYKDYIRYADLLVDPDLMPSCDMRAATIISLAHINQKHLRTQLDHLRWALERHEMRQAWISQFDLWQAMMPGADSPKRLVKLMQPCQASCYSTSALPLAAKSSDPTEPNDPTPNNAVRPQAPLSTAASAPPEPVSHIATWSDVVSLFAELETAWLNYELDPQNYFLDRPLLRDNTVPATAAYQQAWLDAKEALDNAPLAPGPGYINHTADLVDQAWETWRVAYDYAYTIGVDDRPLAEKKALRWAAGALKHLQRPGLTAAERNHYLNVLEENINALKTVPVPVSARLRMNKQIAAAGRRELEAGPKPH